MADGHFPTLVSKDRLPNSATNTIFVSLTDGTDTVLVDASGNLQVILAANDGTDIGDVTINNAGGASAVNIQDGGNSITVDGSVTVSATDLDIRDLSKDQDSVLIYANTAKDGTGTDYIPLVDADGHLQVDILSGGGSNDSVIVDDSAFTVGTSSVTAIGALADETTPDSVDEGDIGAPRMTLDRKLLTRIVGATDANRLDIDASGHAQIDIAASSAVVSVDDNGGSLTIDDGGGAITVDGSVTVSATDLDIRDLSATQDNVAISDGTDTLAVNADGSINAVVTATDLDIRDLTLATDAVQVSGNSSANSETNPIYVKMVNTVVSGSEVHDYDTAASVASDSTSNHDYTVANTTFLLKSVSFAASGGGKVELQTGPLASLATKWVGFIPKRGGEITKRFDPAIEVPVTSTGTVRLIRTNRQGAAQDLYSMIEGNDI